MIILKYDSIRLILTVVTSDKCQKIRYCSPRTHNDEIIGTGVVENLCKTN